MLCVERRIPCKEAYTEKTNFPILKFSLVVRLRGHKQRELNDHVYSFLLFVPLALTIKLNFEISKVADRLIPSYELVIFLYNMRGGEWSFKNSGSRKVLVEFHGSRSLVFLAVMCVSQSRFLYKALSKSRLFARLRVSKFRFVCLF